MAEPFVGEGAVAVVGPLVGVGVVAGRLVGAGVVAGVGRLVGVGVVAGAGRAGMVSPEKEPNLFLRKLDCGVTPFETFTLEPELGERKNVRQGAMRQRMKG